PVRTRSCPVERSGWPVLLFGETPRDTSLINSTLCCPSLTCACRAEGISRMSTRHRALPDRCSLISNQYRDHVGARQMVRLLVEEARANAVQLERLPAAVPAR